MSTLEFHLLRNYSFFQDIVCIQPADLKNASIYLCTRIPSLNRGGKG